MSSSSASSLLRDANVQRGTTLWKRNRRKRPRKRLLRRNCLSQTTEPWASHTEARKGRFANRGSFTAETCWTFSLSWGNLKVPIFFILLTLWVNDSSRILHFFLQLSQIFLFLSTVEERPDESPGRPWAEHGADRRGDRQRSLYQQSLCLRSVQGQVYFGFQPKFSDRNRRDQFCVSEISAQNGVHLQRRICRCESRWVLRC